MTTDGSHARAISLFSGAGGLDFGLRTAGFTFAAHIESDHDCCATLRMNGFNVASPLEVKDANLHANDIDLIVGGPPCQPFSKSSQWTATGGRGFSDERATTIDDFVTVVKAIKPKCFLFENVPAFASMGGLAYLEECFREESGYSLSAALLDASTYGVAQRRHRLFVVGDRAGRKFDFPKPGPSPSDGFSRSVWDYLSRVTSTETPELKGRWVDLLPSIPPGRNYLFHTSRGAGESLFGWRTRYWSFLYKLDPLGLSPTIVANPSQNNGPFHWENRNLSIEEVAALQSFPPTYRFSGDPASIRKQIGNAVPPLLAEQLGRALLAFLFKPATAEIALIPPIAAHPPCVPPLQPVPERYAKLIGDYPDHPGTGRGPKPRIKPPEGSSA